jgi:hypothetical protein
MAFNNFPYTDMHELNLDWVLKRTKENSDSNAELKTEVAALRQEVENLDVTQAVDDKLDQMYQDGDFNDIFDEYQKLHGDVIIVTASFGLEHPRGNPDETIVPFTVLCKQRIEGWNSGRKCYWNAIGGKGFNANGFTDVLRGLESEVTEPNKVGLILVAGGGNDCGLLQDGAWTVNRQMVAAGMNDFVTYARAHYKNAEIRFAWLSWTRTFQTWRPPRRMNEVIGWYKELCPRYSIGYCANSEWVYHQYYTDWYLADNYHPSSIGSLHIADGIMDCIINGSTSVHREEVIDANTFLHRTPQYEETNPIRDQVGWTITQDNGTTTISPNSRPNNPTFKTNYATGVLPGADYDVPSYYVYSSSLFLAGIPQEKAIKFNAYILLVNSTTREVYPIQCEYYAGYAYFAGPRPTPSDHFGSGAFDEIYFYFPSITIPTSLA